MRRCIIWETGDTYEDILNLIKYEELKGTIQCVAVLSKTISQFIKKLDGYQVIGIDDLKVIAFDYLIIAANRSFAEIREEALALGVPYEKIISSRVIKIPNFDFKRYFSLRENPVTILSDDCWGGYVYHELDLPFTSPLININWPKDSYCKFMQDPIYYLEQPLHMEQEGNPGKNLFPIGRLGEGNRSVFLHFVHAPSIQKAKSLWDRRIARINKGRIFIKVSFDGTDPQREKYLDVFRQIPYSKICIYSEETDVQGVFYSRRFERDWYYGKRLEWFAYKDWFRQPHNFLKAVDILKLLNGEEDYAREQ